MNIDIKELETKHKLEVGELEMRIIDLETELSMIRERYDSLTGKLRKISNDKRNNVDNGDDFLRNYGSSGIASSWKWQKLKIRFMKWEESDVVGLWGKDLMEHYTIRCSGLSIFIAIHGTLGRSMKNVSDSLDEIIQLIRELEKKLDNAIENKEV